MQELSLRFSWSSFKASYPENLRHETLLQYKSLTSIHNIIASFTLTPHNWPDGGLGKLGKEKEMKIKWLWSHWINNPVFSFLMSEWEWKSYILFFVLNNLSCYHRLNSYYSPYFDWGSLKAKFPSGTGPLPILFLSFFAWWISTGSSYLRSNLPRKAFSYLPGEDKPIIYFTFLSVPPSSIHYDQLNVYIYDIFTHQTESSKWVGTTCIKAESCGINRVLGM